MSNILDEIIDAYGDDLLLADGFNDAVIGICAASYKIVYSVTKCLEILVERDGMTDEEALEYFQFNTVGAYVGEQTPIFMEDFFGNDK